MGLIIVVFVLFVVIMALVLIAPAVMK